MSRRSRTKDRRPWLHNSGKSAAAWRPRQRDSPKRPRSTPPGSAEAAPAPCRGPLVDTSSAALARGRRTARGARSYPLASTCRAASLLQLTVESQPVPLPHTRRGTNASLRSLASFSLTVARPSRRRSWARQNFVGTCKEACLPRSRLRTTQPHPKNLLPIARNCEKRTSHPCPPPQTF